MSGFDGFSLALFTTLAPAGVIAFIALAAVRLFTKNHDKAVRIDRFIVLPFTVALVGFFASATHLGTPANALHVFTGIGRSPLSNEVFSAVVFLILSGSYWMMAFKQRFPDSLARPWLVLACITGIALLVFTSLAYASRTVITWDTPFTPANLILAALFAGPVLATLFLEIARFNFTPGLDTKNFERGLCIVAAIAFIAGSIVLFLHDASLVDIANNEFAADTLVPSYKVAIVAHMALGVVALVLSFWTLYRPCSPRKTLTLRIIAAVLVLVAVYLTRIAFYDLHMTLGF